MTNLPAFTEVVPYDPDPPSWAREPRVIPGHVQVAPDDEEYDPPPPPQLAPPDEED